MRSAHPAIIVFILLLISLLVSITTSAQIDSIQNDDSIKTDVQIKPPTLQKQPIILPSGDILNQESEPALIHHENGILFFILLLIMGLIAYVQNVYRKELGLAIKAFLNFNIAQQLYRNREFVSSLGSFLLNVNFIASFSIYVYLLYEYFMPTGVWSQWTLFLIIFALFFIIYALRIAALGFLEFLLPIKDFIGFYRSNILQSNKVMGLLIVPFLFFIAFGSPEFKGIFIVLSLILVAAVVLQKYIRGLLISNPLIRIQKLHLILYICTFEIAPILILVRIVKAGIQNNLF